MLPGDWSYVNDMGLVSPTDYGNARRLIARHGKDLRYCSPWNQWLVWDGVRWVTDSSLEAMRRCQDTVSNMESYLEMIEDYEDRHHFRRFIVRSHSHRSLTAMLAQARSAAEVQVLPHELNRDRWLLNCLNGTLDLRTGALRPHSREDLITMLAPVKYDSGADCPRWKRFMEEITAGDESLIGFLKRACGMSLTGDVSEHVLLILHGSGRNGKSTFLNILQEMLGDYAAQAPPGFLLSRSFDSHPTQLAYLYGKRLVVSMETGEGKRMDETLVKQLTGGDKVVARRMREDFWEFSPTHKLWLSTNHKPRILGCDEAMWERIKLIPFKASFLANDPRQDKRLPDKLRGELPGILRWAVEGCLEWQEHGLGSPSEVIIATYGYRSEEDILGAFLDDCCILEPGSHVTAHALYTRYIKWCKENGEKPKSQSKLGRYLSSRKLEKIRSKKGILWRGVSLKEDWKPESPGTNSKL